MKRAKTALGFCCLIVAAALVALPSHLLHGALTRRKYYGAAKQIRIWTASFFHKYVRPVLRACDYNTE